MEEAKVHRQRKFKDLPPEDKERMIKSALQKYSSYDVESLTE